jgi:hypothetical protein
MGVLVLFPTRAKFVNPDGTLTNQAHKALQEVQARTGGANGVVYARNITVVPVGDIAATDVQAAIEELDAEKQTLASDALQAFLAAPSSANLVAAVTDETGTGALVFANTPYLINPVLTPLTAEPAVMLAHMYVNADGTLWDPGSGAGHYRRNAANTEWVFVG